MVSSLNAESGANPAFLTVNAPSQAPPDSTPISRTGRQQFHADRSMTIEDSMFLPQHILERHFVQRQVRHQPLQPGILLLQLLQLE
jgi:hypothetical protein